MPSPLPSVRNGPDELEDGEQVEVAVAVEVAHGMGGTPELDGVGGGHELSERAVAVARQHAAGGQEVEPPVVVEVPGVRGNGVGRGFDVGEEEGAVAVAQQHVGVVVDVILQCPAAQVDS